MSAAVLDQVPVQRSAEREDLPGPQAPEPAGRCGSRHAGTLVVAALAVAGATAVGWRWAGRPPAVRSITMGHGGWVSFKGAQPPPVTAPRPWWAHLLRAQRAT